MHTFFLMYLSLSLSVLLLYPQLYLTSVLSRTTLHLSRGASDNDKHKRSGSVEQNLLIQQALEERKQKRHEAKDRATHILQDSLQSLHSRDQSTSSSQ